MKVGKYIRTVETREKNRLSSLGHTSYRKGKTKETAPELYVGKHFGRYKEERILVKCGRLECNNTFENFKHKTKSNKKYCCLKCLKLAKSNLMKEKHNKGLMKNSYKKTKETKKIRAAEGLYVESYKRQSYPGRQPSFKQAYFVSKLGHKVRSSLEEIGLIALKDNNINYAYEKPYWVLKDEKWCCYFADCTLDNNIIIEFKGYPYPEGMQKLKLFKEQYPNYRVIVVAHSENCKKLILNCEKAWHELYIKDDFITKINYLDLVNDNKSSRRLL